MSADRLDPVAALSAFGRAAYSNLVTVVLVSLATAACALLVVPFGAAVVGSVAAVTASVRAELAGERVSERGRLSVFAAAARANLVRGVPLGVVVLGAIVATVRYVQLAFAERNTAFFVAAVVGVYAVVLGVVWVFRAASLVVRAPADARPGASDALRDGALHLLDEPSFSALQSVFAGLLVVLCAAFGVSVVLLLPGLLAVLEVVCFEEREGDGAVAVVRAYQGTLHGGDDA